MFSVLPKIQRLAVVGAAFSLASAEFSLKAQSLPANEKEIPTAPASIAPVILPKPEDFATYASFLGRQYSIALGHSERLDLDRYGLLMNRLNHFIELGFGEPVKEVTKQLRFIIPSAYSEQCMIQRDRTFYKMQNKDVAVSTKRLDAYLKKATEMLTDFSDQELEKILARSSYKSEKSVEPRDFVANTIVAHLIMIDYFCVASKVYLGDKFELENHADWREMFAAEKVLAQRGRTQAVNADSTYLALKDLVQIRQISADRPVAQFIAEISNQMQSLVKESDIEAVASQAERMPKLPSLSDDLDVLRMRFGQGVAGDLDLFNQKILPHLTPGFNRAVLDPFMASAGLYQIRSYCMLVQDPNQLGRMKRVAETAAWNQ